MDATEPSVCRKAAARCRKLALSSSTPGERLAWLHLAAEWEWLGEAAEVSSVHLLEGAARASSRSICSRREPRAIS
jgi:hypothetical protein